MCKELASRFEPSPLQVGQWDGGRFKRDKGHASNDCVPSEVNLEKTLEVPRSVHMFEDDENMLYPLFIIHVSPSQSAVVWRTKNS
jgi:hypothetical protein